MITEQRLVAPLIYGQALQVILGWLAGCLGKTTVLCFTQGRAALIFFGSRLQTSNDAQQSLGTSCMYVWLREAYERQTRCARVANE